MLKQNRYDCIVLDLDGTLVDSCEEREGMAEKILFRDMHNDVTELWVHKRPGFDQFLTDCFKAGDVGVWSMGQSGYVNAVVSLFPQQPLFIYNWNHCDRDFSKQYGQIFKRLNNIPYQGSILMIDDHHDVLELSDRIDTLIIPTWTYEQFDDQTLIDLSTSLFKQNLSI